MVEQWIADALATLKTHRHINFGIGEGGESSQGNNQGALRACAYKDFVNYKPKTFYGNEGVVGLIRWIKKIECVFKISSRAEGFKVEFPTCTFADTIMSWWNIHVKTMGLEEYCPREEMKRLEQDLWNLTMDNADILTYINMFNYLTNLYPGFVNPEYKKVERYIWGLVQPI